MAQPAYELIWKVRRTFRAMASFSDDILEPFSISAAERAAMEFVHAWGPMSVPDLARNFHVSRQNIQIRVNGLLKRGLMEKRANPAHKKSALIALTAEGAALFAKVRETEKAVVNTLFKDIDDDEIRGASATLSKLLHAMSDATSHEGDTE